jgi:hypothetical protein
MIPGMDILLGGLTGLIGNAFTTWFKYKNAKMDNEHEENMLKLKTQAMIQESQMQIQVTKTKVAGEIEIADAEAYTKSQEVGNVRLFHERWIDMIMQSAEKKKWTGWIYSIIGTLISACFALVDWVNTAMRPTLTLYLVAMSTYITFLAWEVMERSGLDAISATQAVGIFNDITSTMIFLTVSSVTWWYGDRTVSKYLQEKDAKAMNRRNAISVSPKKPGTVVKPGGAGDVDI